MYAFTKYLQKDLNSFKRKENDKRVKIKITTDIF